MRDTLSGYDLYISTDLGNTLQETIASEVSIIMVYVAVIVIAVLLFAACGLVCGSEVVKDILRKAGVYRGAK